jgi:hypothetical protein
MFKRIVDDRKKTLSIEMDNKHKFSDFQGGLRRE